MTETMTELDRQLSVLAAMRELFDGGRRWGQGNYAVSRDGLEMERLVPPEEEVAIGEMCLLGAAAYAYRRVINPDPDPDDDTIDGIIFAFDDERPAFYTALLESVGADTHDGVVDFNDDPTRTYEEIEAAITDAERLLVSTGGL